MGAFALHGADVQQDRLVGLFAEFQVGDDGLQVVAVNRAEVTQTEFLEEDAGEEDALGGLLGTVFQRHQFLAERHFLQEAVEVLVQPVERGIGDDAVEVLRDRADVLVNGPFVVVEDDDEALGGLADVVHRLEGHAVGQRGVADQRHDVLVAAGLVSRGGHAERRRKRRARVARAEMIVRAFAAHQESAQPVGLPDRVQPVPPAGQHLVDVALVRHVQDQAVLGAVEDLVEGQSRFDDAEVRAEMAARVRERDDQRLADLLRERLQLLDVELLHVGRRVDLVQVLNHNGFRWPALVPTPGLEQLLFPGLRARIGRAGLLR